MNLSICSDRVLDRDYNLRRFNPSHDLFPVSELERHMIIRFHLRKKRIPHNIHATINCRCIYHGADATGKGSAAIRRLTALYNEKKISLESLIYCSLIIKGE